jgi:4-hydroxy-tetrahydrodipicolinate synthase
MEFGRLITVMVTPFNDDLSVNYGEARRLARHFVRTGSDSILLGATGGESATLKDDERVELLRAVRDELGPNVPIIVGTGNNNTESSVRLTQVVEKAGADAVFAVVPYYNKPPQEGLYRHFKAIASSTKLPVFLYNVPGRTGVNLLPATVERLAAIPNIVGMKETSGSLDQITELLRRVPPHFHVYTGDDNLAIPALSVGAYGLISVVAQVAGERIREMLEAFWKADIAQASKMHRELYPLMEVMFIASNPLPVKTALRLMGFEVGAFRLPLVAPTEAQVERIASVLRQFGYIDRVSVSPGLYT